MVTQSNNKRIAKNTLLLYFRMFITMAVSLYTSRMVLTILGVEDFGIYSVVGGVVAMFSFIQSSMSAATQRFLSFELGRDNKDNMTKIFSTSISIYSLFSILIVFLAETIGLWFLLNKMQIPLDRIDAAIWVYQCSVVAAIIMMLSIPYNAVIIAHEKMAAFAYISILEVVLKLLIVYILLVVQTDKLILYAILNVIVQFFIRLCYGWYCGKHFRESHFHLIWDWKMAKQMFSFMGWVLNGNLAIVGYTQGVNIILNMFFGPVVNAARGVAVQVQGVVMNFVNNFQMAVTPQLTKAYSQEDYTYMHQLINACSRFSFFLLYFLSLPLILEANQVLRWWLGTVPDYTAVFLRLVLCIGLLTTLSRPITISIHATGNLKRFQIMEGSILLLIVPIAYLLLKYFHLPPWVVFLVHLGIEICAQYMRLRIVLPIIGLQMFDYAKQVLIPLLKVVILSSIIPLFLYRNMEENIVSFFMVCVACIISIFCCVYRFGCTQEERCLVKKKFKMIVGK